jgi:hypothetical protein
MENILEEVVDALADDAEKLFPPKSGGLIDTVRKERAKEQAAVAAMSAKPASKASRAVAVRTQEPEISGARTVVVNTTSNPVAQLLGADGNRKRAVIMALDEPVVVTNGQAQAYDSRNATNAAGLSAGGFVLPVNIPFVVESRGEAWAAATSPTATRVSVWTEAYAD